MQTTQPRRFSLHRLLAGSTLPTRRKIGRRSAASHLPLVDALEARVLLSGTPTQLLFLSQPVQTAATSAMYSPVIVEIADAGSLLTTATSTVSLTIAQGPAGATINNASTVSVSAVSGIATFSNLAFSAPGTYTLLATDGSLRPAVSTTFTVTPAPAKLTFQHAIPNLTAGQLFAPTVEIDDAGGLGHPVTTDHSTVTLTVAYGPDNTILGTTIATPVNGVVTFSGLSLTTAGTYRISVSDGTLTGALSNAFTVTADVPDHLVFALQPASTPVDGILSPALVVDVVDVYGNIVTTDSSTVTMAISSGLPAAGTLSGTTSVQAVNGEATFSDLAINLPGTYVLGASDGSLSGDSGSFNVTGPADHLEFIFEPSQTTAGRTITPGVQIAVEDALGHVIVGDTSTVTLTLVGAGTLSGTLSVAAVAGVASFTDLSINTTGSFQLAATDGLLAAATSSSFIITPAPVSISFAQSPAAVAAQSVLYPSVVVNVLDANGSIVVNDTSSIQLVLLSGPTGGSMSGTTSVSAVAGQAIFDALTFSKPGTYTLLAVDGNLVTETSVDFVVTAPAAKLVFAVQPVSTVAGTTIPAFTIRITDARGNTVTTDHSTVTLAISSANATIGGTVAATAINGVATFDDIFLTAAGKYTFTATDASLTAASSSSFTITPCLTPIPDPNSTTGLLINPMILVGSSTASTLVGKTLAAVTVRQADQYGNTINTVNGGTVTLSVFSGPSSQITGTATAKFVKGVATIKGISLSTAGDYVLHVDANATIPWSSPYPVNGTHNFAATVTPVVNSLRAPSHSANYVTGSTINFRGNVGSMIASTAIPYTGTIRLVAADGTTLETGTIGSTGAINLSFNDLAAAGYDAYVVYDGDVNHTGARSPLFHFNVGATATTTVTTLSVTSIVVNSGDTLTLTASTRKVLTGALLGAGSIEFYQDSVLLTTVSVSPATHAATLSVTPGTGQHTYQAIYVANATYSASTSLAQLVTVS